MDTENRVDDLGFDEETASRAVLDELGYVDDNSEEFGKTDLRDQEDDGVEEGPKSLADKGDMGDLDDSDEPADENTSVGDKEDTKSGSDDVVSIDDDSDLDTVISYNGAEKSLRELFDAAENQIPPERIEQYEDQISDLSRQLEQVQADAGVLLERWRDPIWLLNTVGEAWINNGVLKNKAPIENAIAVFQNAEEDGVYDRVSNQSAIQDQIQQSKIEKIKSEYEKKLMDKDIESQVRYLEAKYGEQVKSNTDLVRKEMTRLIAENTKAGKSNDDVLIEAFEKLVEQGKIRTATASPSNSKIAKVIRSKAKRNKSLSKPTSTSSSNMNLKELEAKMLEEIGLA